MPANSPLEGQATHAHGFVFYNSEDLSTHFGRDAVAQYLGGTPGRLMRSLKSLLGSPLPQETTVINHHQVSFQDIIATFGDFARTRHPNAGYFTHSCGDGPPGALCG